MNRGKGAHKKRKSLSMWTKIGIATASLAGTYWAITSIFFPQSASVQNTQFDSAADIPSIYFKEKREIPVQVVKVIDGDTYRVRHLSSKQSRDFKGSLKDYTLPIRLAAVDTPEIAKNGLPGQPLGEEAKGFVMKKILGKDVTVKLLGKDQYSRVIGLVRYKDEDRGGKEYDLSEVLLQKGLAVVYRQGGARYDGSVERWNQLERTAQQQRRGIWKNGIDNIPLPSEYKRVIRGKPSQGMKS